ncbi:MAG: hypothetical protein ACYTG2_03955 [Planctomycetota bacterium]|jgi:hypothetical protein
MSARFHHVLFTLAASACLAAPAAAQGASIEFFGPSSTSKAISFSADGTWVTGLDGGGGFRWSSATGYESLAGREGWGITSDGTVVAGAALSGTGQDEAALWTEGGGWQMLGNPGGGPGCDAFLSNLFGLSADGTQAAGMSWQVCQTTAMRWSSTSGLTLLPEEVSSHSSRASAISADGTVAGGWETHSTGQRRACVWWADLTQEFLLVSPSNPVGGGEVTHISSDGSVICGVSGNSPFLWTESGGATVLPIAAGLGGSVFANGCSDDGSVVAGVAAQFPNLNGWIWTAETGSVKLIDYLQANGVTGISASDVRNVTGVSADGTKLCGWGNSGSFVVTLPPKTWEDLGDNLAGTHGEPQLHGIGTLAGGTIVRLSLTGALENAPVAVVVGLFDLSAPFKGGVMVPNPDVIVTGLVSNGSGNLLLASAWPGGIPPGFTFFFQEWITDAVGPAGFSATNGLSGTTP